MQRYICITFWGKLSWSNHVKHLGNEFSYDLSDEYEVQLKQGHFYGLVNKLWKKKNQMCSGWYLIWQPNYICHIDALSMAVNCVISAPPGLMLFILLGTKLCSVFSIYHAKLIVSSYLMLLMVFSSEISYWGLVSNFINHMTGVKTP